MLEEKKDVMKMRNNTKSLIFIVLAGIVLIIWFTSEIFFQLFGERKNIIFIIIVSIVSFLLSSIFLIISMYYSFCKENIRGDSNGVYSSY